MVSVASKPFTHALNAVGPGAGVGWLGEGHGPCGLEQGLADFARKGQRVNS